MRSGLAESVGYRLKRQKQELAQAHELYLKGMLIESAEVLRGARLARVDAPTCLPGEIQAVKTHLAAGRLKVALEHAEALKELSKTHCADALKKHESCAEATQIVSEVEEVAELHRSLDEATCDDTLVSTANLLFPGVPYYSMYERAPFHRCTWDLTGGGTYQACAEKQVTALPEGKLTDAVQMYVLLVRADAYELCGFHGHSGLQVHQNASERMAVVLMNTFASLERQQHPARLTFGKWAKFFAMRGEVLQETAHALERDAADADSNGKLNFGEFCAFVRRREESKEKKLTDEELRERFDALDKDKSGQVDMAEYLSWSPKDALARAGSRVVHLFRAPSFKSCSQEVVGKLLSRLDGTLALIEDDSKAEVALHKHRLDLLACAGKHKEVIEAGLRLQKAGLADYKTYEQLADAYLATDQLAEALAKLQAAYEAVPVEKVLSAWRIKHKLQATKQDLEVEKRKKDQAKAEWFKAEAEKRKMDQAKADEWFKAEAEWRAREEEREKKKQEREEKERGREEEREKKKQEREVKRRQAEAERGGGAGCADQHLKGADGCLASHVATTGCYTLLGVSQMECAKKKVQKAFREKSLIYHPDKYKGSKECAEMHFKAIQDAYDKLFARCE